MSTISEKLDELKVCLGEKKLKQLGLIPCSTCIQIMSQSSNIVFPPDLEHKPYLTPEDMSTINASIINTAFNNHLNQNTSTENEPLDLTAQIPVLSDNTPQDISDTSEEHVITQVISSESDLLNMLKSIIKNSHPTLTNIQHSGYIYSQPNIPLPHALCCSECGRLYTISHPKLELLPLPVYLSKSEYEMIKGVYVDILL